MLLSLSTLLNHLQPFRFVERPAVCGLLAYLNYTLHDEDILKKLAIANSVAAKELHLEGITLEIIEVRTFHFCLSDQMASESLPKSPLSGMDAVDTTHIRHSAYHLLTHRPATIHDGSSRTICSNSKMRRRTQWVCSVPTFHSKTYSICKDSSSTSIWMESVIQKKLKRKGNTSSQANLDDTNIFEELNRYLRKPRLTRDECLNPIQW